MDVTPAGMVTETRSEQSLKAQMPMLVTPDGITMLSRLEHDQNSVSGIPVRFSDKDALTSELQP